MQSLLPCFVFEESVIICFCYAVVGELV
jgi:hypothetical protein